MQFQLPFRWFCTRAKLLTILLFVVFTQSIGEVSADLDYFFEKGNEAYLNENYEEAVSYYESILKQGYESGVLYYNLGNAYYKNGNIAKAILNYERALKWLPRDENVSFNLRLANLQVKDRIDPPPRFLLFQWYDSIRDLNSSEGWAIWFTILAIIFAVSFTFVLNSKNARLRIIIRIGMYISLILLVIVGIFMFQRHDIETSHNYGIVTEESMEVFAAPYSGATELFVVHEGTKVRILDYENEWLRIELIDGKQGWVLSKNIGVI